MQDFHCQTEKFILCVDIDHYPTAQINRLTQFHDLLDHCDMLSGIRVVVGDFNVHFDDETHICTKRIADLLDIFRFTHSVTEPTHVRNHVLPWEVHRPADHIIIRLLCQMCSLNIIITKIP